MTHLKRRKRPRMGVRQSDRINCPGHRKFVRGFECCAKDRGPYRCEGPMDAHHSTTRGAGGGDETVVPLCRLHHSLLDSPGWSQPKFEAVHGLDFTEIASDLWRKSHHRIAWERKQEAA